MVPQMTNVIIDVDMVAAMWSPLWGISEKDGIYTLMRLGKNISSGIEIKQTISASQAQELIDKLDLEKKRNLWVKYD